ncbi:MAG: hypothetical protein AB8F34_05405 [Akkermansiaceae bacterium]
MRKSVTSNHEMASMSFAQAAKAITWIWQRKRKGEPVPLMSHALSTQRGNGWRICCAETGNPIAVVEGGMVILIEEDY